MYQNSEVEKLIFQSYTYNKTSNCSNGVVEFPEGEGETSSILYGASRIFIFSFRTLHRKLTLYSLHFPRDLSSSCTLESGCLEVECVC